MGIIRPITSVHFTLRRGETKRGEGRDDNVVFKNCWRAAPEKKEADFINDSLRSEFHSTREKKEANFINDSLRSEFHRKLMN